MPPVLPRIAQSLGIPVILSVHDHFSLCPNYGLTNQDGQYCGLPSDPAIHRACLEATLGKAELSLPEWRARFADIFQYVDQAIFFSEDTRLRLRQVFRLPPSQIFPYGIRLPQHETPAPQPRPAQKQADEQGARHVPELQPFRVCFLGYAEAAKGKPLIQALVPRLAKAGIEVHFLGSLAQDWPVLWRYRFRKQVFFHGRYHVEEAVSRLQALAPHLVGLLSAAPETFSRTLSEAWAAGIPAVVGPVGAQAERVRQTGGGIVLAALDVDTVSTAIQNLQHDQQSYTTLVAKTKNIPHCSEEDMFEAYRSLYNTLLENRPRRTVQEDFIAAIAAYQTPPPPFIEGEHLSPIMGQSLHAVLQRPEQMLMPETFFGQCLGVIGMVYLRIRSVGWRGTLQRPIRKLKWRLARQFKR
jgi:glycosyltransferase involved in cell wall biosynthesis